MTPEKLRARVDRELTRGGRDPVTDDEWAGLGVEQRLLDYYEKELKEELDPLGSGPSTLDEAIEDYYRVGERRSIGFSRVAPNIAAKIAAQREKQEVPARAQLARARTAYVWAIVHGDVEVFRADVLGGTLLSVEDAETWTTPDDEPTAKRYHDLVERLGEWGWTPLNARMAILTEKLPLLPNLRATPRVVSNEMAPASLERITIDATPWMSADEVSGFYEEQREEYSFLLTPDMKPTITVTVSRHDVPILERIIVEVVPPMSATRVRSEYARARRDHFGDIRMPDPLVLQRVAFVVERLGLRSLKDRAKAWNRRHDKDGKQTDTKTFGQSIERQWKKLFGTEKPPGTVRSARDAPSVVLSDSRKIDEHALMRTPGRSARGEQLATGAHKDNPSGYDNVTQALDAEGLVLSRRGQEEADRTKVKVPSERNPRYPAIALVAKSSRSAAEISTLTGIPEADLETRDLDQDDALRAAEACGLKPWDVWQQWNPTAKKATKNGRLGMDWLREHHKVTG